MSDAHATDAEHGSELQQPEFRGCMFCYAGSWARYAGRTAYRRLSQ